jgi:hypothetical protein
MKVPVPSARIGRSIAIIPCSLNSLFLGAHMAWMRRVFGVPASETQMGLILALCIFSMSLMSIALVWQAQVIAKQHAVINMLHTKFGG